MGKHLGHRITRRIRKVAFLVSQQRELRERRGDPYGKKVREGSSEQQMMDRDWLVAFTLHDDVRAVSWLRHNIRLLRRGGTLPQDKDVSSHERE